MGHKKITIYVAGFLFSLPIALMSYINSTFISSFVNGKFVGIIYALGSIVSILALLIAPSIFSKIGGYKFLLWVIALDSLSILLFAFSKNAWSAIFAFVFGFTLNILIFFSLDELLKIFSKDSTTGKIRGTYMTIGSLAWIISQLMFFTILGEFSFRTIYLISFTVMLLFFIMSYSHFRDIPDPNYDKTNIKKYIGKFFKNKNLFHAYGISFLLQFFYCWMVIYTPIYLSFYLGFSWKEIGLIFAVMLLPFSILPFPLGRYADKIGERKMLMFGFTIASLATLSLFFIYQPVVWLWALLLLTTRVGAATIEVMSDAYFFKHIRPENEEFVGVYRTASPIAYIIGPAIASLVFLFVPAFNYIYVILGTAMLLGVYLASTIRKGDI